MAQEQLQSNILLLTNIGAESQYKVFIKYSYNFDGSGDLYDSPPADGGTIYIGIYIGAEDSNPTASDYTWSQYNGQPGENNYIDIRYANLDSGEITLTSTNDAEPVQNGKNPENASLMGVLVTNNAIVMDQDWYPEKEEDNSGIKIEDYTWSEINVGGADAIYYDLKLYSNKAMTDEVVNIKKFFIADVGNDYSLQYNPSKIYLKLIKVVGSSSEAFQYSYGTYVKKYIDGTKSNSNNFTSEDPCINLTSEYLTSEEKEIAYISINFYNSDNTPNDTSDDTPFFTALKEITFLTNAEIAKLSVEATNITLAIQDNKVIFGNDGLTVKNTSFKIVKDIEDTTEDGQKKQEVLLEANEHGDLEIKGIITAQGGKIGEWNIDNNGLITDDGNIGLYGNIDDGDNPNPILLWAGKSDEADTSYNFSIAKNGDVKIEGEVIATSGRILDTFYVGKNNTGITIFGGSEEKGQNCYISTSNFASGSLGYGWKLSQDGTAEFSNIIARGKIQSSVFEHNKISSVGGSLYIAPTIYIENKSIGISKKDGDQNDYYVTWNGIPYASSEVDNNTKEQNIDGQETGETTEESAIYYLKDINGSNWYIGDQLKIDGIVIKNNTAGNDEEKIELSNLDAYIENIQPNELSSTKSNVTIKFSLSDLNFEIDENYSYYFLPGTILIWHGRDGLQQGLFLTASSENGPFMDVYSSNPNEKNVSPMVRLGNLRGISDNSFGGSLSGYGLYTSNAYLRGQLMLPGAGITNQNTKTYGEGENNSPIRIWAGANSADITKANFIVTENGYMYAKQGIFEGTVVATNSEFSGSIRAAGILLEKDAGTSTDVNHDHFYVAYNKKDENNQQILSPLTYLLNIDKNGLSIWEGGLRAYSDRASEINNLIYGYSESNENPLPFFFLVDDIYENEINSRIVAYKGHFLQFMKNSSSQGSSYYTNSIVIDKGIWFYQSEINNVSETSVFQTAIGSKKSGIELINKNNTLQMQSKNINLLVDNEQAVYICATEGDIINRQEKLFIRGSVRVDSDEENLISLGEVSLKEIKIKDNDDKTKTIGLDFIIK